MARVREKNRRSKHQRNEPSQPQPDMADVSASEHLTEIGNARRLCARHGEDIRYCHPRKTWWIWNGSYWRIDETGEIARRAKDTIGSIYTEAAEASQEIREDIAKHGSKSEAATKIRAMIELARSEPSIPVLPEEFDTQPFLLNVRNGTLDLKSGELRAHSRKDLITRCLDVALDPQAKCPRWISFLTKSLGGDLRLIDFLQRGIGYSLTGDTRDHVLFFLYGNGANGKSTFLNTILSLLGSYGRQLDSDILLQSRNEKHPTGIADLERTRFAVAMEIDEGRRLAESLVKQLTGGDRIAARHVKKDFREFWPTHKLWLGANHRPNISGTDNGIWRRILLVPFTVAIPKEEQDRELSAKLREELPGILRWALTGCRAWLREGLQPPENVMMATEAYRKEEDVLAEFIDDMCEIGDGLRVSSTDFMNAYSRWVGRPTTHKYLSIRMQKRGFESGRTNKGKLWQGVRLKNEGEPS